MFLLLRLKSCIAAALPPPAGGSERKPATEGRCGTILLVALNNHHQSLYSRLKSKDKRAVEHMHPQGVAHIVPG